MRSNSIVPAWISAALAAACVLPWPSLAGGQPISTKRGESTFTAAQIRDWRKQLTELSQVPRSTPEGWSKSRVEPVKLVRVFPELGVRKGYVLRAYQFKEEANANGFVWALPEEAEFPEPADCPKLESHFLHPPKPFDALDDVMEAIDGDGSAVSYLHASLLRCALREFGGGWHGISWGTHAVLDDSPWRQGGEDDEDSPMTRPMSQPREWKWIAAQPKSWSPQVRWDEKRVVVSFYTYTALAKVGQDGDVEKERILLHTDTYRRGKYRALTSEKKLAEGPNALAF